MAPWSQWAGRMQRSFCVSRPQATALSSRRSVRPAWQALHCVFARLTLLAAALVAMPPHWRLLCQFFFIRGQVQQNMPECEHDDCIREILSALIHRVGKSTRLAAFCQHSAPMLHHTPAASLSETETLVQASMSRPLSSLNPAGKFRTLWSIALASPPSRQHRSPRRRTSCTAPGTVSSQRRRPL